MVADNPQQPGEHWQRRELQGIPASLGALWTHRDEDGWHYGVQLDESHLNAQGAIHGGSLMTFADHALSLYVWEATGRAQCATIHLDSHFLATVPPPVFVEIDAQILRQGKKLVFARATLRAGETDLMEVTGVWSVAPPRP